MYRVGKRRYSGIERDAQFIGKLSVRRITEMKEIQIILNTPPIPWARPGQHGRCRYDTQKAYKDAIRAMIMTQVRELVTLTGPVALEAIFTVKRPLKGKCSIFPHITPDLDNYLKLYLDICNGIVYQDDGQVCEIVARKVYGYLPVIQLIFRSMSGEIDGVSPRVDTQISKEAQLEICSCGAKNPQT